MKKLHGARNLDFRAHLPVAGVAGPPVQLCTSRHNKDRWALTISGGRDFASSFLPWEVSSKSSCAVQSATLRTTIVTRAGIAIVDNTGGPEQGVLPAPEIGTEDRASIGRAAGPSPHPARIDLPLIFVSVLRIRSDSKAFTATSSQR